MRSKLWKNKSLKSYPPPPPRKIELSTITRTLLLCLLCLLSFCLSACSNNPGTTEKRKIALTKENLFDYVSFNVNYSEHTISLIDEKYFITCKVEFSTAPRIPNIEFENVTIQYNTGSFLAIGFNLRNLANVTSQFDNKGYSFTSFYCYNQSDSFYPTTSFPEANISIADIQSIEGSVIVEVAKNA